MKIKYLKIVPILLLVYLIFQTWPSMTGVGQGLRNFVEQHTISIFLSTLFMVASFSLRGYRWAVVMQGHRQFSSFYWGAAHGWSMLWLTFMPFRTGEVVRPVWLKRKGGSISIAITSILYERACDTLILVFFLILSSPYLIEFGNIAEYPTQFITGLLVCAICAALFSYYYRDKLALKLHSVREHFTVQRLIYGFLLSVASWLFAAASVFTIVQHTSPDLSFETCMTFIALVNLSMIVAVTPGNIGLYETIGLMTLTAFGISSETAFPAVLIAHITSLSATILYGCSSSIYMKFTDRQSERSTRNSGINVG